VLEYKVIFLGICAFIHMSVGGHDVKRMVMPNLSHAAAPIGRHVAFVMLPSDGYDGNDGWGVPQHATYEKQDYVYFLLDGDEISLDEATEALQVMPGFDNVPKLKTLCQELAAIDDAYLFGRDATKKIAQMDVTNGKVRARTMFAGMIATELAVHTKQNLSVSATSWKTGTTRSIRVKPGTEVWIGNNSEAFFDPNARHDVKEQHFLAFYQMAKPPVTCTAMPSGNTPAAHAMPGSPTGEVDRGFGVDCSNSQYP
jgi:hypothetical protein